MKLNTINTGLFKLDGGAMHGVVPKSMWNKVNPSDENNMCTWSMRCLLIESNSKLILIDTGMGTKQDAKFFSHFQPHGEDNLISSIEKAGYSSENVTDVFLTHLHFDHCGGAISREGDQLVPTFKNARYWSHTLQWGSAMNPNAREKASFLKENIAPIQESGRLRFYDQDNSNYFQDIMEVKVVEGHTESMMLPLINYNGKKILFCADLIPSVAHISLPWVMGYDMKPLNTLQEKELLLTQACDEQWLLFFEHDPLIELVSLQHTDKGIRQKESLTISDL